MMPKKPSFVYVFFIFKILVYVRCKLSMFIFSTYNVICRVPSYRFMYTRKFKVTFVHNKCTYCCFSCCKQNDPCHAICCRYWQQWKLISASFRTKLKLKNSNLTVWKYNYDTVVLFWPRNYFLQTELEHLLVLNYNRGRSWNCKIEITTRMLQKRRLN